MLREQIKNKGYSSVFEMLHADKAKTAESSHICNQTRDRIAGMHTSKGIEE